jgi:hypothetical protein
MSTINWSEEIDHDRRRFSRSAAMAVANAPSSQPTLLQFNPARSPRLATHTPFYAPPSKVR